MEDKIFDIVTDLLRHDISKNVAIGRLSFLHDCEVNQHVPEHEDEEQFSLADMKGAYHNGFLCASLEKRIDFEEWLETRT